MNDFCRSVTPAFAFLVSQCGYHLLSEDVSPSFDNGQLVYASPAVRIVVTRDRGQVFFSASARGDPRDVDDEILALLIEGVKAYPTESAPRDFSADGSASILHRHLASIEQLLSPSRLAATLRNAGALKGQRAHVLFGATRPVDRS